MARFGWLAAALLLWLWTAGASVAGAQSWAERDTLYSPLPGEDRQFARSVAVDGDLAVVSDPGRVDSYCSTDCGAVHIYRRGTGGWAHEISFHGEDDDRFGVSVDVSGDTVVVGAPREPNGETADAGAAYVLSWDGSSWSRELLVRGYQQNGQLGTAVAIDGDVIAVGTPHAPCGAPRCGRVSVFRRDAGGWSAEAGLVASTRREDARFGFSLDVDAATVDPEVIVVGARSDDSGRGLAYVFDNDGTGWSEAAILRAPGTRTERGSDFGWSVAVDGDTALASVATGTYASEAAHVFVRGAGGWSHQAGLGASIEVHGSYHGALEGDAAVVGPRVFVRSGTSWSPGLEVHSVVSGEMEGEQVILGHDFTTSRRASVGRLSFGASMPDGGVPDAGTGDGGLADAGLTDAGLIDAGLTDAGLADAGAVDASTDGAIPQDAGGGTDAASPDAGPLPDDDAGTDSGTSADAGRTADAGEDVGSGGGCGCRAARGSAAGSGLGAALLLLLAGRRRRRA